MRQTLLIIVALAFLCAGALPGCASSGNDQAAPSARQGYAQQGYAQQGYAQQGYAPQGAAGQGYAQPGGAPMGGPMGGAGRGPGGHLGMLFTVIDANGDGRITYEEFQAFQVRDFSRRDANGDQSLSREEFTAIVRPPNQGGAFPNGAQPAPMQ